MKKIFQNQRVWIFIFFLLIIGIVYFLSTPKLVEIIMKNAVTCIEQNDFVGAQKKISLSKHINNTASRKYILFLSKLCVKKIEQNDYNSAQEIINFIKQLTPQKNEAYSEQLIELGKEKVRNNLYEKAGFFFDIAQIFNPTSANAYLQKGKLLLLKTKYECSFGCDYSQIIQLFSAAIDLDKNCAEAYAYRGSIYFKDDNSKNKAYEDFNKVVSLNTSKEALAVVYAYKAITKLNENDYDGFKKDKRISEKYQKQLNDKTDYSNAFWLLSQGRTFIYAKYGIDIGD